MEGGRDVGLGSQLALQRQAALGVGRNSDQDQGPHCFLCWELPIPQAWEGLHKKTALSLLLPTSGAQGGKGRADPALAMWGAYQRIQGHGVGEGKLTLCFLYPDWGWDPPTAVTISTSFCCVLYMGIFISCLTMLCSCGLSTSEETVF